MHMTRTPASQEDHLSLHLPIHTFEADKQNRLIKLRINLRLMLDTVSTTKELGTQKWKLN